MVDVAISVAGGQRAVPYLISETRQSERDSSSACPDGAELLKSSLRFVSIPIHNKLLHRAERV